MSKTLIALSAFMLIGTAIGFAGREAQHRDAEQDDARTVSLQDVPTPARKALAENAGTAKIVEVTMEDEDGIKVYEATWQIGGVDHEMEVTERGDTVATEHIVSVDDLPQPVREAAGKFFPPGTTLKAEQKTIVLYELAADIDGREKEVLVAPTGQCVNVSKVDDDDHEDHEDHEGEDHEDEEDDS